MARAESSLALAAPEPVARPRELTKGTGPGLLSFAAESVPSEEVEYGREARSGADLVTATGTPLWRLGANTLDSIARLVGCKNTSTPVQSWVRKGVLFFLNQKNKVSALGVRRLGVLSSLEERWMEDSSCVFWI